MVAPYPADLLRPTLTFLPTKPTDRSLGEVHFACDHREEGQVFQALPSHGCLSDANQSKQFIPVWVRIWVRGHMPSAGQPCARLGSIVCAEQLNLPGRLLTDEHCAKCPSRAASPPPWSIDEHRRQLFHRLRRSRSF